jgi:hypothetical protein
MKIAGIVLIFAGVIALVYGGFTYTTTKKAVDMGPCRSTPSRTTRFHCRPCWV